MVLVIVIVIGFRWASPSILYPLSSILCGCSSAALGQSVFVRGHLLSVFCFSHCFSPPSVPASPGTPGLALRRRHGSATVLVPWAPTPMGTTSHRQASAKPAPSHQQVNHPLTSPSSKHAVNPSLRPAGAFPLGPQGTAFSSPGGGGSPFALLLLLGRGGFSRDRRRIDGR